MKTLETKSEKQAAERRATQMAAICNFIQNDVIMLKARWMDEKDYEDFKDYQDRLTKTILKFAPENTEVISITKNFLITLQIPGFPYIVEIFCNMREFGWKQSKK